MVPFSLFILLVYDQTMVKPEAVSDMQENQNV